MPSRTVEESHRPRVSDRTMHCHSSSGQPSSLLFQKTMGAVTTAEMEPQERRIDSPLRTRRRTTTSGPEEDHSWSGRSNGWAECREKKSGIEPKGRCFLLTFPLIGLFRPVHQELASFSHSTALGVVMPITAKYELRHFHPRVITDRSQKWFCQTSSIVQPSWRNAGGLWPYFLAA